jgi:23S rRNA pseudouridine1911/1915/1917 synthase
VNSFVEYVLLESIESVEEFLKLQFGASSNKCKKYFDKSFLNRSFEARSMLRLPLNFVNDGMINSQYEGPEIEIIYEDELFLVLNKPANIFVHPLCYEEKNNCLSFLRSTRPNLLSVNIGHYDRGLLYRLDFETSGVLVYVKNVNDYRFLREHFNECAKKKIYVAVVEGDCRLNGKFLHYFSSKEIKGRRVTVSDHSESGDEQVGELSIISSTALGDSDASLLEVELKSGLRHQIRAQLSHLNFPIRGDEFYGGKVAKRLYLHALKYELIYKEKSYQFITQPSDFNGV